MIKFTDINLDNLFRRKYAEILSALLRKFGYENIEIAEESIQEAFQKAIEKWSISGAPENQSGWIFTVAQNSLIDSLRKKNVYANDNEKNLYDSIDKNNFTYITLDFNAEHESDNLMIMIFLCCNPNINPKAQFCITLKAACGFSVHEISRLLDMNYESVKKLISRAKEVISSSKIYFKNVNNKKIYERFPVILEIIYAMFTEGYTATKGEFHLRKEVAEEAIHLCGVISNSNNMPEKYRGELMALYALMLFQFSRFEERADMFGNPKRLQDQDRKLWNSDMISAAFYALEKSKISVSVSYYHYEARIAAEHALSKSFYETNWKNILLLYNKLLKIKNVLSVKLNRIAALHYAEGPDEALNELNKLISSYDLVKMNKREAYYYHSLHAELLEVKGFFDKSKEEWYKSLGFAPTEAEKNYILNKIKVIR